MIPLRFVETDREDFDEPVIELWRDDEFVGMVFWDGEMAVVQIFADAAGEVYDLALSELMHNLDLAEQIVTPEEFRVAPDRQEAGLREGGEPVDEWAGEHPATLALVEEFDPTAAVRTEDGEGFFRQPTALEFVVRCSELDLAVVEAEGFDLVNGELKARANMVLAVSLPGVSDWAMFRPTANALVTDTIVGWGERDTLVVAFVVQQPDGETFVA